ncbi:MAG: Ig domain-containing protein [Pirellulales bacterium]
MSALIDDLPIPLDFKFQIRSFLNDRLPPDEILFARSLDRRPVNPLTCGNDPDYFSLPYPVLPPISIGEYQCPTGFSRYGRALFMVDWFVLGKIAKKCWGWANENAPADIPSDWVTGSPNVASVSLKFGGQEEQVYHVAQMYPLTPYRIPGLGVNLWLLPLVDRRYFMRQVHEPTDIEPANWTAYFSSLATELGITASFTNDFLDSANAYRKPDVRLYNVEVPQESAVLMDIAALSVGLRPIYDPVANTFRLQDAQNAGQARIKRLADPRIAAPDANSPTSPLLIAGGRRGSGIYPEAVNLWVKKDGKFVSKSINLPGGGVKFTSPPIWTSFEGTQSEIDQFATRVADDLVAWSDSGGQYCFAGIVVKTENVCGFDDFLSIKIAESQIDGQQMLTTRFYEVPALMTPQVLLVNGKSSECGGQVKYFTTAEDAETSRPWVWCKHSKFDKETGSVSLNPDSPELFKLYYAEYELSLPAYAKAGYTGMYTTNDAGILVFLKGFQCIGGCQADGSINLDLPNGTVDEEYSHTVTGTAIDPDTIDVIDLPDGLELDAETNQITGTPTTAGVYQVVLRATSTNGCLITKIQDVTITEAT